MAKQSMTGRPSRFTTVRLRAGYDRMEVDGFLLEVEGEIKRLGKENSGLRRQLEASPSTSEPMAEPAGADPLEEPRSVLAQAEREHAEFLDAAYTERERIIDEASRTATEMIENAEQLRKDTIKALKQQKKHLVHTNEALQAFERGHRSDMKAFMRDGLKELGVAEGS